MSFIHQAEDLFYGYASSKNCLSFAGRGGDLFIVKLWDKIWKNWDKYTLDLMFKMFVREAICALYLKSKYSSWHSGHPGWGVKK